MKEQYKKDNKAVLFVSNVPSPYNVDYLNELGKLRPVCAVFERGFSSERDDSWKKLRVHNFTCHILKGIHTAVDTAFSPGVIKFIHLYRKDHIIIGNPATPTGILAILYCRLMRIPYLLQSEGGFRGSGKGLKEKFKKFLMGKASLYLSGMSLKNEYFLTYGATAEKLRHYPFTSVHKEQIYTAPATVEEKQQLRKELGIEGKHMLFFVGQFIHRKALDVLLNAMKELPENAVLVAAGGEPTEEYKAIAQSAGLKNVCYAGFLNKETIQKYYRAADIFVLPTREDTWGLVINEAMACGLPVVTTDRCVAGLQLIENDINGYIIPVDDTAALAQRLNQLLANPDLMAQMSVNNLQKIQPYTIENMAQTIHTALQ